MPGIHVNFSGPIRRPWREQSGVVEMPEGSDVEDLLRTLGFDPGEMIRVSVLLNGRRAEFTTRLHEGDRIDLILLVGGG